MNKSTLNLPIGTNEKLITIFTPLNATNQNVSWSSSDNNIATVDNDGIVTGVALGTAIITGTTEDGNKTAICEINVVDIITTIDQIETYLTSQSDGYRAENPAYLSLSIHINNDYSKSLHCIPRPFVARNTLP